jgi:hypothetical protein
MKIQLVKWLVGYDELGRDLPASTPEHFLQALRDVRDILLRECDWTQAADVALSDSEKQEWVVFRQVLRDLPSQYDATTITEVIDIVDPPASAPRTWVVLTPEHHAQREAEWEAIERAIEESNHAAEDHTGADHTH